MPQARLRIPVDTSQVSLITTSGTERIRDGRSQSSRRPGRSSSGTMSREDRYLLRSIIQGRRGNYAVTDNLRQALSHGAGELRQTFGADRRARLVRLRPVVCT